MGAIRDFDVWARIATQTNRTTKASSGWLDLPVIKDGFSLRGKKNSKRLETEHRFAGEKYRIFTGRNDEDVPLRTLLHPEYAGALINGVFARDTNGKLTYHSVERYWDATLGGSQDVGASYEGVVIPSMSIEINRSGEIAEIEMSLGCRVNAKRNLATGTSRPTFTPPTADPYTSGDALIDFVYDNTAASFGGDNTDVERVSISFDGNVELRNFLSNPTDDELHVSWSDHVPGEPTATIEVDVIANDQKYLRLDQGRTLVNGSLRVGLYHPGADTTTTVSTITTGDVAPQTLAFADASAFTAGEVVLMQNNQGFVVLPIDSISTNDVDFDTETSVDGYSSRVTLNGGTDTINVYNQAQGFIFDEMALTDVSEPKISGNQRIVTLSYEGRLKSGNTSVAEVHAYNHA